jgi:hypothetical protein
MIQHSLELVLVSILLSTALACGSPDTTRADDEQAFAESDEDALGSIQQALEAEPEPEEPDAWPRSEYLDLTHEPDAWPISDWLDATGNPDNWPRSEPLDATGEPDAWPKSELLDAAAPPSTDQRPTY